MSSILVFLQHNKNGLPKSSAIAIAGALKLKNAWNKSQVVGLLLGPGATSAADQALQYGLEKVLFSEDASFEKYLAGTYTQAVMQAMQQNACDALVATATSTGKDLLPRLAALLDAGQASDITAVNQDGSLRRPMFAGDIFADVEITTSNRVVSLRASAFAPAEKSGSKGTKTELKVNIDTSKVGELVSYETSKADRPELSDAEIVVSGGRALQSSENFEKYIFPLADSLGAAVGASRAAVDSGYAPNDWQVGQTGKIVAPNLYIAVGISGAIQHLAGMKDSKTIVAINKDPDAPIYEIADYGLVGDLYEVLPKLTEAIKVAKH